MAKYNIRLVMGESTKTEVEYKSSGKTVNEALDALNLNYTQIAQKGTIHLQSGKKKGSRFFYVRPLRRVLANKLRKAQVSRDLERLLE